MSCPYLEVKEEASSQTLTSSRSTSGARQDDKNPLDGAGSRDFVTTNLGIRFMIGHFVVNSALYTLVTFSKIKKEK